MTNHQITKDFRQLRGFSTDSIFKRPAFVGEKTVNMMRLPDGTFSPRRGYQVQATPQGGLGTSNFRNFIDDEVQQICISGNGLLYKKQQGSLTITFNGIDNSESLVYQIYVDPLVSSDGDPFPFDPYSVINPFALVTDSINFMLGKTTSFPSSSIGTGSETYTGSLGGGPIIPGSITMTDGTLTITDVPDDTGSGTFAGDVGIGPNAIDYSTGAYSVTFSGVTGAVVASYLTQTIQFDQAMGLGYGTNTPFLISQLIFLLLSTPGVSVSSTGDIFNPGAFLEVSDVVTIANGSSVTLNFWYWVAVNHVLTTYNNSIVNVTFPGLVASLSTDDYVNATFASFEKIVLIANKFDLVQKFDGQTVYNAGIPNGVSPSLSQGTSGNVDVGLHTYYMTYQQIDATGRLVEGVASTPVTITVTSAASIVLVTLTNLLQGSGWNTNCAQISSPQSSVNTIAVLSPHTIRQGDTAFFIDASGAPQTRNVIAITASSVTIDGSPVSVTNATQWQTPISNNLKINIYRTVAPEGTEPFFVFSIPNNSYQNTTVYDDNTADANLGTQFEFDEDRHDPPPKVGVVYAFNNLMIYTVDPLNEDSVFYSNPNEPEYVDQLEDVEGEHDPNRFTLPANDDNIIGCGTAGTTLVVFKDRSIYAISGEIATEQFTAVAVAQGKGIGCVAHATIVGVAGLLYFLHTNGVYSISEINLFPTDDLGNPIPLTIPIDQFFRQLVNLDADKQFVLKRAVAVDYTKDNQYLLFLPCEEPTGVRAANEYSRIICYDYQGKNFFEWTNINAAGGFIINGDDLLWQSRSLCVECGIDSNTYKQHRKYRLIDQADHVSAIPVTWISSWEDFGQPRVRKKFVRASLLFDNISSLYQLNLPVMFFFTSLDWNAGVFDTQTFTTTAIEGDPWGVAPWNWMMWSGYQDTFFTVPLRNGTVAKSVQIGLQLKQLNTSFSLQGFQIEISPDFGKAILR